MKNYLETLKSSVSNWNAWRKENPEIRPDLSDADLRGADLRGAHLWRANLSGADLRGAHLSDASLNYANLSGADLRGANLSGADLNYANINEAKGVMLLFRDPRYEEKGYQLIRWTRDGEPWFNSGCHSLPKTKALRHWGRTNYENKVRGKMYTDAIETDRIGEPID